MSTGKCGKPNCEIKIFEQCKISDTNNVCVISGVAGTEDATCTPSGSPSYTYDEDVCSGSNSQSQCEEKYGCKWDYIPLSDSPLTMGCKVGDVSTQSCQSDLELNRYSLKSKKTFGCDEEHCNYEPEKKTRENGVCMGNTNDNDPDCVTLSNGPCITSEGCKWVSNDEAHCGYHRNIENYLDNTNGTFGGQSNISDLNGARMDPVTAEDPCLRIKNPGKGECEEHGCIWDINGNRKVENDYNTLNVNGLVNENYYDINTSGVCLMPDKEACMNNFCYKSSGIASPNYQLPDGKCRYGVGTRCSSSNEEIVTDRTPGLIDYSLNLPDSIKTTREFHGTNSASNGIISNVNKLLGVKYNHIISSGETAGNKKDRLLVEMNDIFKQNCELIYRLIINQF